MQLKLLFIYFLLLSQLITGQEKSAKLLLADSSMIHAAASVYIVNSETGEPIFEINPERSLTPASVMKLVTSSAALELLGPEYTFKTRIGYTGSLNQHSGVLKGNVIIEGGGDPVLGSENFISHYENFLENWINEIRKLGIKKVEGRVITDDSRYDYQPVPPKWLWEDAGNYYGAGAYGLSVFDNSFEIHFRTFAEGSIPVIKGFNPEFCRYELINRLKASGDSDKGYIFSAPYGNKGWIEGSIPANREDFVLKASVSDPPLLLAKIITKMLDSAGISVSGEPSSARIMSKSSDMKPVVISEISSPPLKRIIEVLNHESVNLYAEHLLKELGKIYRNDGTTIAGVDVLYKFLEDSGINSDGIFLEDGSGLSPVNSISAKRVAEILSYMRNSSKYFNDFYASLPEAAKEGTLKNCFSDPVFRENLRAKSGSMTRVRSYAGYCRTLSGNDLTFCIIINNYSGSSQKIITGIEDMLKEAILQK
jgi:serine-type D-Ala-D-Ala carboxypeptidase/endopeptidase (penicillin-binding protein 4)